MNVADFWATKWDKHGNEELPTMYTVWYKGTPIKDTENPLEWIRKAVDEVHKRIAETGTS